MLQELMITDGDVHGTNWLFTRDAESSESDFKLLCKKGPNSRFLMNL